MDVGLELAFQMLLLADARQSRTIEKHPLVWVERNPMVRKYGVTRYFAAVGVTHLLVSEVLPSKWVPYWQYGSIGVEALVVGRNARLGIRMSF